MTSAKQPSVSAIIPVHNGERFLADAISSVLEQTHPVLECLVIDDGSNDGTSGVAAQFDARVRYIRQDQAGVSAARNHGLELARGDFVAFLDHDDVWLPGKLARQLELLSRDDRQMALCAVRLVDVELNPSGIRRVQSPRDLLTGLLMFDQTELVSCSSTGVLKREAAIAIGGFDPNLSMSADWDLVVRMLLGPGIAYVDEPLSLYRLHESNMHRRIDLLEHDMVYAFAKTFANPLLPESVRRQRRAAYGRLYRMLAGSYRDAGQVTRAVTMAIRGSRYDPGLLGQAILRAVVGRKVAHRPETDQPRAHFRSSRELSEAQSDWVNARGLVIRRGLKNAYFQWLASARVDALLRRLHARKATTFILNLHRVSPDPNPYWPPMTPEAFARLVSYLVSTCQVIGLTNLAEPRPIASPRVVLSFDDGFGDFVEYAMPILDRYGLRVNQNVIVESVEHGQPPWIIRVMDALAVATPSRIRALFIPGFAVWLEGDDELAKTRYGTLLADYLKWLPLERRRELCGDIDALLAETSPDAWTPMMSRDDVKAVSQIHELGAHSYSHEPMGSASLEDFADDLDRCDAFFSELRLPMSIYAFPYGSFRSEQIEVLKARRVEHVLLVGERPTTGSGGVHTRITMYGDTDAELRLRAIGHRPRL